VRNALLRESFIIVAKEVVIESNPAEGTLYPTIQKQLSNDGWIRVTVCCERQQNRSCEHQFVLSSEGSQ
jgi:hypothetical protein